MTTSVRTPVLWLTGAIGTGKSDTSYHLFSRLFSAGTPTARIDHDDVGMCHPAPADDPENYRVKAELMAEAWRVFERHGARCLVISGGVNKPDDVALVKNSLPDADWTVVRLRIDADERRRRIIRRGSLLNHTDEHMSRWVEAGLADEADLDTRTWPDHVLDTNGLTSAEVVDLVLTTSGWPDL
jgi:hypothetical protein